MNEDQIPYHFAPRKYQREFLWEVEKAINGLSPKRFFYQIWHRRSGKDKTDIADVVPSRLIKDPCLVKYIYPTLVMGRENLWDGIGSDGFHYREHIPKFIRAGQPNNTLMKIPVKNEKWDGTEETTSIFQVGGSDKPDSLRGGNPKLFILSEWAEQDPYTWDVIEPIVRENDGIIILNTTPKGDNHARATYEFARNHPKWFVQLLTAKDTNVFSEAELMEILKDIIKRFEADGRSQAEAEAYFEQEYMCSFNAPVIGAYYGANIQRAEQEGRITHVPYIQSLPVDTYWDLGIDDSMTIWFAQNVGQEIHLIDYYENSGEGFPHYAMKLQEKGYYYGKPYAPHDIAVRELGSGKSRLEMAHKLGIKFEVAPNLGIDDGINAARSIFSQCWFDKDKCSRGINALKNYRKEWDEKNKVFRSTPKHDWASHGADGFRILGVSHKRVVQTQAQTDFGTVKPYLPGIG